MISDLLSVLGRSSAEPAVIAAIQDYGLADILDAPPNRRYVGSRKRGICLLFEEEKVIDIQVYVEPTKKYNATSEELPFGLERGMTQPEVHNKLGSPQKFDEYDSTYNFSERSVRLVVVYNLDGIVRYLSMALSGNS